MSDIDKVILALRETSEHISNLPWDTKIEDAFKILARHLEEIERREYDETTKETSIGP